MDRQAILPGRLINLATRIHLLSCYLLVGSSCCKCGTYSSACGTGLLGIYDLVSDMLNVMLLNVISWLVLYRGWFFASHKSLVDAAYIFI